MDPLPGREIFEVVFEDGALAFLTPLNRVRRVSHVPEQVDRAHAALQRKLNVENLARLLAFVVAGKAVCALQTDGQIHESCLVFEVPIHHDRSVAVRRVMYRGDFHRGFRRKRRRGTGWRRCCEDRTGEEYARGKDRNKAESFRCGPESRCDPCPPLPKGLFPLLRGCPFAAGRLGKPGTAAVLHRALSANPGRKVPAAAEDSSSRAPLRAFSTFRRIGLPKGRTSNCSGRPAGGARLSRAPGTTASTQTGL